MSEDEAPTNRKRRRQISRRVKDSLSKENLYARLGVWEGAYLRLAKLILDLPNATREEVLADGRMGLNHAVLVNAAYSYFYDVFRAKDFSGSKRLNRPKKAAYTIKWIVMEKPIWFRPEAFGKGETIEILSCINEFYALRIAMGYAEIPTSLVEGKIFDDFLYELSFRKVEEGFIAFWFETFMDFHGLPVE